MPIALVHVPVREMLGSPLIALSSPSSKQHEVRCEGEQALYAVALHTLQAAVGHCLLVGHGKPWG